MVAKRLAKPLVLAATACLVLGVSAMTGAATAVTPPNRTPGVPPVADRIAATTATFNAIEAKVAAGQSLRARFSDGTAQSDILDYGVNDLWQQGIDGAGVTVAYIVTNPDPTLQQTLDSYDTALDLPPANITQMSLPAPSDPNFTCVVECSTGEDTLDAEAIHSMAPYANIIFVHPSVPETIGVQGWPQVAQAIKTIADEHLADIITVSLGDGESDFVNDPLNPGADQAATVHSLDPAFLDAAAKNVPVLFASGDCGPTDPPVLADTGQCTPAIGVTAGHPADNPWVTAVGGTIPNAGLATPTGRTAPDALWVATRVGADAEGAGVSTIYPQPSYQKHIPALAGLTGYQYPTITMDSSNGTSQASPTFAGILALATQLRGRDLGLVNPAIDSIGPRGTAAGIVDVPAGYNNTAEGVPGYDTGTGYDVASGWGTIFAPQFVPALVGAINRQFGLDSPAAQAQEQLSRLQHRIVAAPGIVPAGRSVTVTAAGFVPGSSPNGTTITDGFGVFPPLPGEYGIPSDTTVFADPTSTVPGQTWDTVTATLSQGRHTLRTLTVDGPDADGTVHVAVDTAGLPSGLYTVTVSGDVLSESTSIFVQNFGHGFGR